MVLPLKLDFGNNQVATGTVIVQGPSSPVQVRLPMRPKKVDLDPDHWIIAEKVGASAK
jgi:hypothetical protein